MIQASPNPAEGGEERRQLMSAAALIQLEARVRSAASGEDLGFLIVNETHQLVPYRVAAFWLARSGLNLRRDIPVPEAAPPGGPQGGPPGGPPGAGPGMGPGMGQPPAEPSRLSKMFQPLKDALSRNQDKVEGWKKSSRKMGRSGMKNVRGQMVHMPFFKKRHKRSWLSEGRIVALSGVAKVDREAPAAQWLERLMNYLVIEKPALQPIPVTWNDVPDALGEAWGEWLPPHALHAELRDREGKVLGAVLLTREEEWQEQDINIFSHVLDCYAHGLDALLKSGKSYFPRPNMGTGITVTVVSLSVAAMFLPVDLSVLAPAEIVAAKPVVVASPLQGVVSTVEVRPNQDVEEGETLLKLDNRDLRNRLAISGAALKIARTEYEQAVKQAIKDERVRPQVAVLRGKVDQFQIERNYVRNMLSRVDVAAPRSGVAIFEDPNDLIGVPVEQGQRLMMIADAHDMKIRVHLPVSESLSFNAGAKVRLFLNIDPDRPIDGTVTYIGYRALPQDQQGLFAYRINADITDDDISSKLRIGLKGTAKIYSEKVSLFYYLFRRPLATLRQKTGL